MTIRKLLVANRGEIAARVFRTCRELGIATVAVAAPDDRGALHTREADETVEIASYLHSEEHIRAAKQAGADAIHPGYGFLAESADFAEAVGAAGLVFVGPSPEALRAGGDKLAAKRIAREAGVPVVPQGEPDELGFPLMIKAAAGGGGRGMRVVREPAELAEALEAARREAEAAFGDGTVFCERYVERPRHVEIQLLGDEHGTVVALGERECSVQRRHQKVLEESPSVALDPALRAAMSDAAVAVRERDRLLERGHGRVHARRPRLLLPRAERPHPGRAPGDGAGDGRRPRPRAAGVAQGEPLDLRPELRGHAVEVRLYAEDPRTFLPQAGPRRAAAAALAVRVDAGVAEGDEVGTAYDPMIAKLIAHGETRDEALDLLREALDETEVGGVTTNLPFLRWLVRHPALREGGTTTAFLTDYPRSRRRPRCCRAGPGAAASGSTSRPPPAPPPDIDGRRARPRRRRRAERAHRADAGHRDPRPRRRGRPGGAAPAGRRARGDEDGDAGRRRPTTRSCERCTSARATASPAAPCSSSSRSDGPSAEPLPRRLVAHAGRVLEELGFRGRSPGPTRGRSRCCRRGRRRRGSRPDGRRAGRAQAEPTASRSRCVRRATSRRSRGTCSRRRDKQCGSRWGARRVPSRRAQRRGCRRSWARSCGASGHPAVRRRSASPWR